jgi:deoxyribose-phosphate aldolase
MPPERLSRNALAAMIDHAVLSPAATEDDLAAGCEVAGRWKIASLCVRPCDVAEACRHLAGSGVAIGTVIGFPHGSTTTAAKVAETRQAVDDGADELDMVLRIGVLRSGRGDLVGEDIAAVVAAASGRSVKVIAECGYLDRGQIVAAAQLAVQAGAQFIKTSTGFGPCGARLEDVRLLRQTVGPGFGVKAAGGIRSAEDALAMVAAGANRLGTSATEAILAALE